ncbi:hypothetical protein GC163_20900 [bacterium]|nr:hypothetical protein [bacterium]
MALAICGVVGYFGWTDLFWRGLVIVFAGYYFGYLARGRLFQNLQEKYPRARGIGLLSIGMVTLTLGVLTRMTFQEMQGGAFDVAWLVASFIAILAFVIINRRDPDIWR